MGAFLQIGAQNYRSTMHFGRSGRKIYRSDMHFYRSVPRAGTTAENGLTFLGEKCHDDTQVECRTPGEFRKTTGDERQPYARSATGHDGRRHTILDSPLGPLLP